MKRKKKTPEVEFYTPVRVAVPPISVTVRDPGEGSTATGNFDGLIQVDFDWTGGRSLWETLKFLASLSLSPRIKRGRIYIAYRE